MKAMSDHAIPRLFVSPRNDKSPIGFNWSICRKDVSFLPRGARGISRHFKCKSHCLKGCRYHYDHEDVIYTEKFDLIRVADLSAELRAEIEETPPVVLGRMNKFIEDEVDALVGVPSNVPPTTLVGCLFELLRSRGSQVFLRRLWNQLRTTLADESPYASVTWSKTETLVVLVQTLYRRVLRRVKSWLGDGPFSLALQSSYSGVKCIVRCCPDDCLRDVYLFDEDHGAVSCESEMQCVSRVLSLVSTSRGPRRLWAVLFNAYVDWCCSVGRPVPLVALTFGPDLLRRLINESSFVCVGAVDPFATVEYLVQRLKGVRHQAWLLNLPQLRLCLESGVVPFESLCGVLQELLDNWADVKLCLSNDVLLMKKKRLTWLTWIHYYARTAWDCLGWPYCTWFCYAIVQTLGSSKIRKSGITLVATLLIFASSTGVFLVKWRRSVSCHLSTIGSNMLISLWSVGPLLLLLNAYNLNRVSWLRCKAFMTLLVDHFLEVVRFFVGVPETAWLIRLR